MDIKKLMTGANPQSVMLEQTRGLKAKWEKTGLLEGVGSETTKHGMAVMLENQAKQLLDEATRTGTSSGSEEWAGVALPLVRRIFGAIAAKEFVSVQPMNLPSGLIFYMDFKYGTQNDANRPASVLLCSVMVVLSVKITYLLQETNWVLLKQLKVVFTEQVVSDTQSMT